MTTRQSSVILWQLVLGPTNFTTSTGATIIQINTTFSLHYSNRLDTLPMCQPNNQNNLLRLPIRSHHSSAQSLPMGPNSQSNQVLTTGHQTLVSWPLASSPTSCSKISPLTRPQPQGFQCRLTQGLLNRSALCTDLWRTCVTFQMHFTLCVLCCM